MLSYGLVLTSGGHLERAPFGGLIVDSNLILVPKVPYFIDFYYFTFKCLSLVLELQVNIYFVPCS